MHNVTTGQFRRKTLKTKNNTIKPREIATIHIINGKAAGVDGLTIEHFKYAHPVVLSILKHLFSLMLRIGYVPSDFGRGLIIPIPKKNLT